MGMTLSVLVTTFGRRPYLERCVASLMAQERPPDQLVLVTRAGDDETEKYVAELMRGRPGPTLLQHARVTAPGVLEANRAGMRLVSGDIVCFIDDDAAARPDWLRRIEAAFAADPALGAIGGRDLQHTTEGIRDERTTTVGRIFWYGRVVGNHHKDLRGARHVDTLKGVNMSFRRELIPAFDTRIRGHEQYYEMDLCFAVRRRGYRILYDSTLVVDHYVSAPRFLPGHQQGNEMDRHYYIHHNRVYVMMKNLSVLRRGIFLVYSFLVDGGIAALNAALGRQGMTFGALGSIYGGKVAGLRTYLDAVPGQRSDAGQTAG